MKGGSIIVGPWWIWIRELDPSTYAATGLLLPIGYIRDSEAMIKARIVEVPADNAPLFTLLTSAVFHTDY